MGRKCVTSVTIFIKSLDDGKTRVVAVPKDTKVADLIHESTVVLSSSGKNPMAFKGDDLLRPMDTVTVASGKLLGGSESPLLQPSINQSTRVHAEEEEKSKDMRYVRPELHGQVSFKAIISQALPSIMQQLGSDQPADLEPIDGLSVVQRDFLNKLWPILEREIQQQRKELDERNQQLADSCFDQFADQNDNLDRVGVMSAIRSGFQLLPNSNVGGLAIEQYAEELFNLAQKNQEGKFSKEELTKLIQGQFDPQNLTTEEKIQQILPLLDLQQAFWVLVAVSPDLTDTVFRQANFDQQQLLQLV